MSNYDEWQKQHNQELARKQREMQERQARERRERERAEQDARSKKALRDAHNNAASQFANQASKGKSSGCLLISLALIGGVYMLFF